MSRSWSDRFILDDRVPLWVMLAGAGVQLILMCAAAPVVGACFAGVFIVGAMHMQITRNEHRLQLLADRLLYGHACDECIEYEGQRYCFSKMRTS